ncbi:MAG: hypothetical protein ABW277_04255 [Longimicrobiaceae bacterium]
MRRSTLPALVLVCSACSSRLPPAVSPSPEPVRGVGIAVRATRGPCTVAVVGGRGLRVCLPGRIPQPADTAAADTVRTHAPGSAAAAGGR